MCPSLTKLDHRRSRETEPAQYGGKSADQIHRTDAEHAQCPGRNARSSMVRYWIAWLRLSQVRKRPGGILRQIPRETATAQSDVEQVHARHPGPNASQGGRDPGRSEAGQ